MTAVAPVRPSAAARRLPEALAAATVLSQIAYPLVGGALRDRVTVLSVLLFAAASVSHATLWRGARFAALLTLVTAGGGLAVEALGVRTGVPFGAYDYGDTLGLKVLGVPFVIPLAWTMMGYPALLVAQRITSDRRWLPVAAGAALASWDLFLDPQMVDAGHWVWRGGSGPAVLGVPLVNFAGWFLVATAMMALLTRLVDPAPAAAARARKGADRGLSRARGGPRSARSHTPGGGRYASARDDRVPFALYLWTYASSVLAHVAFFGLPGSALLGGVGMGLVVWLAFVRRR